MGILGYLLVKGAETAAKNATIAAVGSAAANVISATSKKQSNKEDATVKHGMLYLKPTRSSDDYLGANVSDIAQELLGNGFENVKLKPVKKLGQLSSKKYGTVCSISIGGKTDFSRSKKVPASSYIVIEYWDFKDSVNQTVYEKVKRIESIDVQSKVHQEAIHQQPSSAIVDNKRFCCYCGEPIQNSAARFCSACGKEV